MPQETKTNSLKRSYPGEGDDKLRQVTDGVLTDVISILKSQEKQDTGPNGQQMQPVKGFVPPPNTPCSKD